MPNYPEFAFDKGELLARREARRTKPKVKTLYEHEKTTQRKKQIWDVWKKYAGALNLDAEDFWLQFLRGDEDAEETCKEFLETVVRYSYVDRVVLGPEEYEKVRTINAAGTVQDKWAALVAVVNEKVMEPKRRQHPERAHYFSLTYSSRFRGGTSDTPVNRVAKAIPMFTTEMGLDLGQLFTKRETTPEDIALILDTLWTRSKDIPCDPDIRMSFHCAVILAGIGGWRPASVVSVEYKDITFAWVRHPSGKSSLVADIRIRHVKQGKMKIKRNQKDQLVFTIARIPCQLLALTDFLVSKAIADDAFAAGYQTVDEVLNPSELETNYVPLEWKPEVLDPKSERKIISIRYNQYLAIWNRTLLVAGMSEEDKLRPYAMRVGAAGRLDGSLTNAMRNFILSQSTQVHQDSYQPVNIRDDLLRITFNEDLTGTSTQELIDLCHRGLFRRDPYAPIYVEPEDVQRWEERKDLIKLREEYKNYDAGSKEAKQIQGKIQHIRNSLETLQLEQKRAEYFREARRLRQLGESAQHLHNPDARNPRRALKTSSIESAMRIGELLSGKEPDGSIPTRLVAYAQRRFDDVLQPSKHSKAEDCVKGESLTPTSERKPRCLFGCRAFTDSTSLSRHVLKAHQATFSQSFICPECRRLGKGDVSVGIGMAAWCSHVQRHHDAIDRPAPPDTSAHCLLCGKSLSKKGFNLHFNNHIRSGQFKQPFSCPACHKHGAKPPTRIESAAAWIMHIRDVHANGQSVIGAAVTQAQSQSSGMKRPLDEEDGSSRKRQHIGGKAIGTVAWDQETKANSHTSEEFWVTGRECDEMFAEHVSDKDKILYK